MLTSENNVSHFQRTCGFSLIELMFAMLIGIIILGGIFSLFTTTRNTQRSSEDQLRLVADARFAIDTLVYDLRHAGSYGANNNPEQIYCRLTGTKCTSGPIANATGDCFAGWYKNAINSIDAYDAANPYTASCAGYNYKVGTDSFGVKYADSTHIAAAQLAPNVAYVRTNFRDSQFFVGAATWVDYGQFRLDPIWETRGVTRNHRLVGHFYYVSGDTNPGDGMPSLRRSSLEPGPQFTDDIFIPGVVDMQMEYGVDSTGNGSIDSFVKASALPVYDASSLAILVGRPNFTRVQAVRIWLLLRAERPDRDGIAETGTFLLAGNPATVIDTRYRHYMVSSIVDLRNVR